MNTLRIINISLQFHANIVKTVLLKLTGRPDLPIITPTCQMRVNNGMKGVDVHILTGAFQLFWSGFGKTGNAYILLGRFADVPNDENLAVLA